MAGTFHANWQKLKSLKLNYLVSYQLNSEAYNIFIRIEIGIREFLIEIIKDKGVNEWTKKF